MPVSKIVPAGVKLASYTKIMNLIWGMLNLQVGYSGRASIQATGLHEYGGWERDLGCGYRFENHQCLSGR